MGESWWVQKFWVDYYLIIWKKKRKLFYFRCNQLKYSLFWIVGKKYGGKVGWNFKEKYENIKLVRVEDRKPFDYFPLFWRDHSISFWSIRKYLTRNCP